MDLVAEAQKLEADVIGWFQTADADIVAALKAFGVPAALGLYQMVKSDAETALAAAGRTAETMLIGEYQSLVATVKNAIATAAQNVNATGAEKFKQVFDSIMSEVKNGLWSSIPAIAEASLNALINALYPAFLAGL